jgi:uncharacterized protein with NRDE domain
MCLILVAWRAHPDYPLVLAANRDEFFARPAAPAQWWPEHPGLLAGRDLQAGGTWLGITRSGRFAALTNYRDPARMQHTAPSRGALVRDWLLGQGTVPEALAELQRSGSRYNGFNLMLGDAHAFGVYESVPNASHLLGDGIYGLSNHLLDTAWPKVQRAKSRLATALEHLPDNRRLLELLRDDAPAADHELPRTGVSDEWERLLSSAFIRAPGYGTRCSTLLCVDRDGRVRFDEWTWDQAGADSNHVSHQFETRVGATPRTPPPPRHSTD